ncbi:uncharacterized protein LOC111208002 [Brassica napus]|uniref:uncharacterized protein LOC111208002 n=1 Tax=Brassica napus TaxID=3708 RepID=UPI000BBEDF4F|nr:uncharacterized protein LOC111208002 [Brassica napus]
MKSQAVNEQNRRSKRQAGVDASPVGSEVHKKQKKNAPKVNEREESAAKESTEEEAQDVEVDQHSQTEVEEPIPASSNGVSNTYDTQTQQSEIKTRKTRGLTKMRKVAKNAEDKVDVEFNSIGEDVGSGPVTLSSFLGPLVREHVPVLLDDWRHIEETTKDALWEEIQGRFNLTEEWQKDAVFKQMGCLWRASKSRLTSIVRSIKYKSQIQKMKPSNIQSSSAWNSWVQSDKYRRLMKIQIPHTTSQKGMSRLAHEMKRNNDDPKKVTRTKVWVAGHTHSDGRPVNETHVETIIKTIDSEIDSNSSDNIGEDAVSQVLGKERPGRVRGMGRGATITKIAYLQARDKNVQKLEATQAELITKLEKLQNVVIDLAGEKTHKDDVPSSERSDGSKRGIRCQILDWISTDDVVVGEGEYYSSEPTYKIGRIPLGPNAAAVIVNSIAVEDACVW